MLLSDESAYLIQETSILVNWMANLAMAGGPASCTTYDKEVLLKAVLDGQINPGKVFT